MKNLIAIFLLTFFGLVSCNKMDEVKANDVDMRKLADSLRLSSKIEKVERWKGEYSVDKRVGNVYKEDPYQAQDSDYDYSDQLALVELNNTISEVFTFSDIEVGLKPGDYGKSFTATIIDSTEDEGTVFVNLDNGHYLNGIVIEDTMIGFNPFTVGRQVSYKVNSNGFPVFVRIK